MKAAVPALLGAAIVLSAAGFLLRDPYVPEARVPNRPVQETEAEFASSNACRACHPSQYASWRASYHRTMTQVATPETVLADFDGATVIHTHGRPMTLERRGSEFWATFDDPDADASVATPTRGGAAMDDAATAPAARSARPRITRQVVMITGSHHQQVYWYATGQNRLLGQLPAIYLIEERRWIPRRAAVLHAPSEGVFSETGHWNGTCIACHTTNGKPQFDTPFGSEPLHTQVVDTRVTEFGISCEACHGPSTDHARANRSPIRRYASHLTGRPDPTTVLPTRLDPKLSSQVCGQCHGVWEFYDAAGERHANSRGLPFRPGDELARTRFLAQPTRNLDAPTMQALLSEDPGFVRDSFWADGTVRVSGREYNGLIESPCFKDAREPARTLTCFSCHSMHQPSGDPSALRSWANDQITPGREGNAACLQCHQSMAADVPAHTKHQAGSEGSSCYNCHMPYTSYGLLKTIRSHTISSPSVKATIETGRPNACNLCHLDKTLAWTDQYLTTWYGAAPTVAPVGPSLSSGADTSFSSGAARSPDAAQSENARSEDRAYSSISAALLSVLRGDAGERAIVAQAMAWKPAQAISGTEWMLPHLAQLLDDPYDAVRFIAGRSLRTLPEFAEFTYDFAGAPDHRRDAQRRVMSVFSRQRARLPRPGNPALLLTPDADVDVDAVLRLLKQRNNRRMLLRE